MTLPLVMVVVAGVVAAAEADVVEGAVDKG